MKNKKQIKQELKAIKEQRLLLKAELMQLPKEESINNNENLPRKRGRFINTLKEDKIPKTLILRTTTIETVKNKAIQAGLSFSEFVDIQLEKIITKGELQ